MLKSPLLLRVIAVILPAAVGVLLLMAGVFAALDWQDRRQAGLTAAQESVAATAPALGRNLWQLDVGAMRANLDNLVGRENITGLVVASTQGTIVGAEGDVLTAGAVPEGLAADPQGWTSQDSEHVVKRMALEPPERFSGEADSIGTLAYIVQTPTLAKVFGALLWENVVVFGAAGLAMLAAVIAIVWRQVIRPVEIIRHAVVSVRGGSFARVPWTANDEIGALAADVNKLVDDLEEGQRAREAWYQSYYYFPVTGLPNRNFLLERLNALIRGEADGQGVRNLLVLIDLDGFHLVNEAFGEALGDRLLIQVGERLQAKLPSNAFLAHIATDQFCILTTAAPLTAPLTLGQGWRQVLKEPFELQGREVYVRGSVGVAQLADHENGDLLLRDADTAMHEAKHAGGDRAQVFDPSTRTNAVALLKTDSALQTALSKGHIKPYYQPLVDLAARRITGFEVLARWEDPEHGLIRPDQFIPVAEKTGTIAPMAEQLMHQALTDRESQFAPYRDVTLSLNLAPQQMLDHKFLKHLRDSVARQAPQRLYFEITESTMMRQWAEVTRGIESLAESGATLLLDDFGTGESSLAELHALPFDGLKIDKGFLKTAHDKDDWSFVATIVALAQATNLSTVAEGIEYDSHIDRLLAMGCKLGQGFLFAKPLPVAEAAQLLGPDSPAESGADAPATG